MLPAQGCFSFAETGRRETPKPLWHRCEAWKQNIDFISVMPNKNLPRNLLKTSSNVMEKAGNDEFVLESHGIYHTGPSLAAFH
jgi:hypothetical protein